MTSEDIKRLRALCEATTQPGPWTVMVNDPGKGGDGHSVVVDGNGFWVADCGVAPDEAALIAAARTALPALLDEVERMRGVWDRGVAEMTRTTYAQVALVTNRLHETETERDRLRALLREACGVASIANEELKSGIVHADIERIRCEGGLE